MSSFFASSSILLAMICVFAAVCLLSNSPQVASMTVPNERAASQAETIDMVVPSWQECRQDEYPAVGVEPTCEPTCANKKPPCNKVFVMFDFVPCFCKKGLLRDTQSGRCVKESECKAN